MAINLDSPEEIRKRAAASRARTPKPTLRSARAQKTKFKASASQPGRTGGAPRTPGATRATKTPHVSKAPVAKKGILRSSLGGLGKVAKVGVPIAGAVLAAGEAAQTEPLRSDIQKKERGGPGVSFLRTAGESATAGGSEQFAGIAKDDARAFAEIGDKIRNAKGVIPTAVEMAKGAVSGTARLAALPQRALLRGIRGVPTGQEPDLPVPQAGGSSLEQEDEERAILNAEAAKEEAARKASPIKLREAKITRAPFTPTINRRPSQDGSVLETARIEDSRGGTAEITGDLNRVGAQLRGPGVAPVGGSGTFSTVPSRSAKQVDSEINSLRSLRATQLGIPEEALPYIDAGGRVSEVRKTLRENLGTTLDTSEGAVTPYQAADLKLRAADLQSKMGTRAQTAVTKGAVEGRAQGAERRTVIDRMFEKSGEKGKVVVDPRRRNEFEAVTDGVAPADIPEAARTFELLNEVRTIQEEAGGGISEGGTFEFIDRFFGLNPSVPGVIHNKEMEAQLAAVAKANPEAYGELFTQEGRLRPRTKKILEDMRRTLADQQTR